MSVAFDRLPATGHDALATKADLAELEIRLTNRLYAVAAALAGLIVTVAGVAIAVMPSA